MGYGYSCQFFSIPEKYNYDVFQTSVFMDGENYCVAIGYVKHNPSEEGWTQITDIFTINAKGTITYTLEMQGMHIPQGVFQDCYVYVGYSSDDVNAVGKGDKSDSNVNPLVVFFDKQTGEMKDTILPELDVFEFVSLEDRFALIGSNTIAFYDERKEQKTLIDTGRVGISRDTDSFSFFSESGKYYVQEKIDGFETVYHEVDLSTGVLRRIAGEREIGMMNTYIGPFMFDEKGEYRIDLSNLQVRTLAKFADIDIRPPKKGFRSEKYTPLDDKHFAKEYYYLDGTAEILFFTYDSSIDYSEYEKIVIGGYNLSESAALQWAIYNFNISNSEYRAVLVDYNEQFGFENPEDAQKQKLSLMKYFKEGNAPDIYFGYYFFDFEYMGRNGMILDMLPFIQKDKSFSFDDLSPSIRKLMDKKDHIYQLFPSYWLNGHIGLSRVWKDNTDISIFDLYDVASARGALPYHSRADEIVIEALEYNFQTLWSSYKSRPEELRDDIHRLLAIAFSLGEETVKGSTMEELFNEIALLQPRIISGLPMYVKQMGGDSFSSVFIGYPSLDGSVHLINPEDLLAISNTTKHPDVCWDIIRRMFDRETQELVAAYGAIPVNDSVLQEMCVCAVNHEKVEDELIKNAFINEPLIDEWIVEDYLKAVYSVDTIITYDWGVSDIIRDEIGTYYSQGRSIDQISDTLIERLNLYYEENYQ